MVDKIAQNSAEDIGFLWFVIERNVLADIAFEVETFFVSAGILFYVL